MRPCPLLLFAALSLSVALSGCRSPNTVTRPNVSGNDGASAVDYDIWIDSDVETAVVKTCAEGRVTAFRPALRSAASALVSAHQVLGPRTYPLQPREDGTIIPLEVDDPCIHLKIDIGGLARRELSPFVAFPFPDAITVAPDLLFWRPLQVRDDVTRTASIRTAPGVQRSVPWPRMENGRYSVSASTFRQLSILAFGAFEPRIFEIDGVEVSVAILRDMEATEDNLRLWMREAIRSVSLATGHFPVRQLQIVILPFPAPLSEKPVAFGMAARGGGAAAYFIANQGAPGAAFVGEWVAVHELSHLLLPFVDKRDAWLSEGLATYHQNVLRARAGLLSEEEGWFELVEGIVMAEKMAKEDGRSIADATGSMQSERNYRQVYWTGATLSLLLDVRLRLKNGVDHGLNIALRGLDRAVLDPTPWRAKRVLKHLDQTSQTTVGKDILDAIQSQNFPEIWPYLDRMGVQWVDGKVVLDDTAELVGIRRAIMARPVPTIPPARAAVSVETAR